MKSYLIENNILYLEFENIKDECIMLFRPSEYYESPHKNINGKVFTFEDFLVSYVDKKGGLDYFSFWEAFNIPGHILTEFRERFIDLTSAENRLYNIIDSNIDTTKPYYLISNVIGDREGYLHELAHAIYYLYPEYKIEMDIAISEIPNTIMKKVLAGFRTIGYPMKNKHIIADETQAWMATSYNYTFYEDFDMGMGEAGDTHTMFKKIFKKYYKQLTKVEI